MHLSARRPVRRVPVLHVAANRLEWFDPDPDAEHAYAQGEASDAAPQSIASTAAEMVRGLGGRPTACVLALGTNPIREKTLHLPGLSGKDLHKALARKAANLLEAEPADTLFSARLFATTDTKEDSDHWLLLAMRRGAALQLRLELRRRGFRVKRVVSSRLALQAAAAVFLAEAADDDSAAIAVGVEREGVSVSLLSDKGLVQQTLLEGSIDGSARMQGVVVQELRRYQAYWNKLSQGGDVGCIISMGVRHESMQHLEPALRAAMPGVQLLTTPAPGDKREHAPRIVALEACLADCAPQMNLAVKLPFRHRTIVAAAVASLAIVVGTGDYVRRSLDELRDERLNRLAALQSETVELDRLLDLQGRIRDTTGRLDQHEARLRGLASRGFDVGGVLNDVAKAFAGHADLLSVSVDAMGDDGSLEVTGRTDANPGRSLTALEQLAAGVEASPYFHAARVTPATGVPELEGTGSLAPLSFSLHGDLTRSR